jgi:hypothetical protein
MSRHDRHNFIAAVWIRSLALATLVTAVSASTLPAQTTSFTYQGKLNDGGSPANGTYDLQFRLFDALVGGNQVGSTVTRDDVTVLNGIFSLSLDFGAAAFPGANRFLEIAVRPGASTGAFTSLTPLQPITSTPYSIKSLSAASADALSPTCSGCVSNATIADGSVTNAKILDVSASKITGTIPVAAIPLDSSGYIQNTATPQPISNFNISGDGTAGGTLRAAFVSATTQFSLNGGHILSSPGTDNVFAGSGAGESNTTGFANALFGKNAGRSNTEGESNAFFGAHAGQANTSGYLNAFFGMDAGFSTTTSSGVSFFGGRAGRANTTGTGNSFFGSDAGYANTTGVFNSFFGSSTGLANTVGNFNAFFGDGAGGANTTGSNNALFGSRAAYRNTTGGSNTFVGDSSGPSNTTGNNNAFFGTLSGFTNATGAFNTMLGYQTNLASSNLTNATAVGANAYVASSNALVLGSINGVNQATSDTNVGIGTTVPATRLDVVGSNNITVIDAYNSGTGAGVLGNSPAGTGVKGLGTVTGVYGAGTLGVEGVSSNSVGVHGYINSPNAPSTYAVRGDNLSSDSISAGVFGTGAIGVKGQSSTSDGIGVSGYAASASGSTTGVRGFSESNNGKGVYGYSNGYGVYGESGTGFAGYFAGKVFANGNVTLGTAASNNVALTISGPNTPEDPNSAQDIRFSFASAGSAGLRSYRGSSWDTYLSFLTNNINQGSDTPQVRMHINDSGNVGIGTTIPADKLHVFGNIRMTGCLRDSSGNPLLGACLSDARLKKNIVPFSAVLEKLVRLQPVHFDWRTDEFPDLHFGDARAFGLVAQEVEKVLPELVIENEQGYKTVQYHELPLLAIQALNELNEQKNTLAELVKNQQAQIEGQQAQIRELKSELDKVIALINAAGRGSQ